MKKIIALLILFGAAVIYLMPEDRALNDHDQESPEEISQSLEEKESNIEKKDLETVHKEIKKQPKKRDSSHLKDNNNNQASKQAPTKEELIEHLETIFNNTYENEVKRENEEKEISKAQEISPADESGLKTYKNQYENHSSPVDILWVIDDSGSMTNKIKEVSEKIDLFLNQFIEKNVSFKMAAVNTSRELLHDGSILNSINYRDDKSSFFGAISETFNLSSSGNGEEQGFLAISDFLDSNGEKFLRKNSRFVVIVISDEDDGSLLYGDGKERLMRTQTLLNKITEYRSLEEAEVYSIVSFPPHVAKIAGIRYAELSYQTKGLVADIKSDFHQTLLNIGGRIIKSKLNK
ncbi:hypothetical protein BIY24_15725 [Halobacteriovorax marinus]|uniref:vWA domain-containing protein n=1 Tax=Halobacteriovorax marinus TaxID=97084 RepID=UPI000BC2FDF2|nr:vWA domain-containing protein [Halobacteriovorax marinus]ATH09336.1 hypothetical protein BIY24_15725 [Halobacteriovorax marinus]